MGERIVIEGVFYALAAVTGSVAAVFHFGGLWLTVQRLADSSRPHLLLGASFIVRAAVVLVLFYAIGRVGLAALLLATAGFIVTRILLTHRWGVSVREGRKERGRHADAG